MKYTTLQNVKQYGRINQLINPISDDNLDDQWIAEAVALAENSIDTFTNTGFQYQTNVNELADIAFVDENQWLIVQTHYPVCAVQAINYMDREAGDYQWQPISLDTIIYGRTPLAYPNTPPLPDSYKVMCYSLNPIMATASPGGFLAQVTYTSGYEHIPEVLTAITNRVAWWKYQLRSAALGEATTPSPSTGQLSMSNDLPKDIRDQLKSWVRTVF
jgi:hypothetical protein